MATFKAVVSPYRKTDGRHRVNIRVVHNRAYRDIPTPFLVDADQMTRSLKIKDRTILDALEKRIQDLYASANKIGFLADDVDIDHFVALVTAKTDKIDFFEFMEGEIERIRKEGRDSTAGIYQSAYNSLRRYHGNRPLYFSSITRDYVGRYFDSLSKLRANTQNMYIGKLHTLYKRACEKYNNPDVGVVVVRPGVFESIRLPAREYSRDNAMKSVEDMQRIIDAPYKGGFLSDLAKDMFVLAFVCLGTNIADFVFMEKKQYVDGILYYRRKKTGRSSKENVDIQIRVPEVGRIILDKYSGDPKYLINFHGHARSSRFTTLIHYYFAVAGLEEMPERYNDIGRFRSKYTFYANRHSMASFARNVCGIDYMTVHEMLNHVAPSSFRNTDAYLWKDYTHLWEANDKLVALFDWGFYLDK